MSRLLVEGGTLLGLTDRADVRRGTDLYATDGRIAAIGEDASREAALPGEPVERIPASGKWIIPGFVQAHLHLCQTLLRNGPEELSLLPWLERHIWPGEAAHDPDTLGVSARLGLAECLASGVTAVLDMGTVRHSDAIFRAAARSGIRYTGGNVLMDDPQTTPANLRTSAEEGLAETERLRKAWHGRERERLRVAVQPRFAVSCTDGLLRSAGEYRGGERPDDPHPRIGEPRGMRPRAPPHRPRQRRVPGRSGPADGAELRRARRAHGGGRLEAPG